MRIALVSTGLFVLLLCLIFDRSEFSDDVNPGYFLVSCACLLAAALWRDNPAAGAPNRRAFEVFNELCKQPLTPEELIDKLTNGNPEYERANLYRATIGKLILDGHLLAQDGRLRIAAKN